MGTVTLTTDFGLKDAYVGVMKGVILGLAPHARIVDLSHGIEPQDVAGGAYVLASACRFFQAGTIHVAVVDPGVGTSRRGVVIRTAHGFLVGPDNGVFSGVLVQDPALAAFALENPDLMRPDVSATFHGRDVFAPAAAHLLNGVAPEAFGPAVPRLTHLDIWSTERHGGSVTGGIVHIDRFGNCVTNIGREAVTEHLGTAPVEVLAGGHRFGRIVRTFEDVASGRPLVYFGSLDTLEVGVNGGDAAAELGLTRGDRVQVTARQGSG